MMEKIPEFNKKPEDNKKKIIQKDRMRMKPKSLILGASALGGLLGSTAAIDYNAHKGFSETTFKLDELDNLVKEQENKEATMPLDEVQAKLEEGRAAEEETIEDKSGETITITSAYAFTNLKPKLPYHFKYINPSAELENLQLPGKIGKFGIDNELGKIALTLRYKSAVNDAVERYNLPEVFKETVLSMIMEETTGLYALPNATDDSGFGVLHMQPQLAKEFGLKTYKDCGAMVCNGKDKRSCRDEHGRIQNHAKELREIIESGKYTREELAKIDERLSPLLNIDAAVRMMARYYYSKPVVDDKTGHVYTPFESAIMRYAGKHNYQNYITDIKHNMLLFKDLKKLKEVEDFFNKKNPNFKINGEEANYKRYQEESRKLFENYGLESYNNLPRIKFVPKKP